MLFSTASSAPQHEGNNCFLSDAEQIVARCLVWIFLAFHIHDILDIWNPGRNHPTTKDGPFKISQGPKIREYFFFFSFDPSFFFVRKTNCVYEILIDSCRCGFCRGYPSVHQETKRERKKHSEFHRERGGRAGIEIYRHFIMSTFSAAFPILLHDDSRAGFLSPRGELANAARSTIALRFEFNTDASRALIARGRQVWIAKRTTGANKETIPLIAYSGDDITDVCKRACNLS